DRGLAPGRKSQAFLHAAETVRDTGPDELAKLHAAGKLTDLPGIGASTAKVIAQSMDGRTPERITELEPVTEVDRGDAAASAMRDALRGDCHTHSTWSDGGASIRTMAEAARALGHDYLVVTDHSPRLTIAHGLNAERLRAQLDEIDEIRKEMAPFRILTGIEVDILVDGTLDQDPDLLAQLDVVVASVHSKLSMDAKAMTERMARAVADPNVDILGHCTGRKVPRSARPVPLDEGDPTSGARPPSNFDAEVVFAACARFGTAVEINCRPERQDPPEDLLRLALEWDCRISIDTDSHAPGQLEWQPLGCIKAAAAGVEPERVINTLPADDLVAWTKTHATF
ncbi:MAG: PHP domain-containing protein, partial [Acidimicrobiales bacterium]